MPIVGLGLATYLGGMALMAVAAGAYEGHTDEGYDLGRVARDAALWPILLLSLFGIALYGCTLLAGRWARRKLNDLRGAV